MTTFGAANRARSSGGLDAARRCDHDVLSVCERLQRGHDQLGRVGVVDRPLGHEDNLRVRVQDLRRQRSVGSRCPVCRHQRSHELGVRRRSVAGELQAGGAVEEDPPGAGHGRVREAVERDRRDAVARQHVVVGDDAGLHGASEHPAHDAMHGPANEGPGRPQPEERRRTVVIRHHQAGSDCEDGHAEDLGHELFGVERPVAYEDVERELGPDLGDVLEMVVHAGDEELLEVEGDQLGSLETHALGEQDVDVAGRDLGGATVGEVRHTEPVELGPVRRSGVPVDVMPDRLEVGGDAGEWVEVPVSRDGCAENLHGSLQSILTIVSL